MGDSQFVDQYGQEQPDYGMEDNMVSNSLIDGVWNGFGAE